MAILPSRFVQISIRGNNRRGVGFLIFAVSFCLTSATAGPSDLRPGIAEHAFDHLGSIGEQAGAAARSGANIIYVSGLGAVGYLGLPEQTELLKQREATAAYLKQAKRNGIRLAIGYVCATSIVKLDQFDRHWPPVLRQQFHAPPTDWRQQDRQGKVLRSWYGGDYEGACMNNPDWRAYERFIVRQQLEAGCDGIFFDNPTVHPDGCYCHWCMEKFAQFIRKEPALRTFDAGDGTEPTAALRAFASTHHGIFLRFRCTIARDFLADMRKYARTVKASALITANNSLNSSSALYSQCRSYAYNIYEMSKAEDFIVVEDMSSQPRTSPDGQMLEYGPTYQLLHAIGHGKPVVAVTLAEGDYHTPPNLVRLAMAEAAANGAFYLCWPTWPEAQRERMITEIRPEADFLRRNAELIGSGAPRQDVVLFLPFRKWLETGNCAASHLAAELSRQIIPYKVICEDELAAFLLQKEESKRNQESNPARVLVAESPTVFAPQEVPQVDVFRANGGILVTSDKKNWLEQIRHANGELLLDVSAPPSLRARVFDEPHRTVVHLLNLNVQRLSSFADKVTPATNVHIRLRVPFTKIRSVRAISADLDATSGPVAFSRNPSAKTWIEADLPRVDLSTLIVIE